jgi:hypothetical protein
MMALQTLPIFSAPTIDVATLAAYLETSTACMPVPDRKAPIDNARAFALLVHSASIHS